MSSQNPLASYRSKKAATFSVQWISESEYLSVTRVRGQDVSIKFEKNMVHEAQTIFLELQNR